MYQQFSFTISIQNSISSSKFWNSHKTQQKKVTQQAQKATWKKNERAYMNLRSQHLFQRFKHILYSTKLNCLNILKAGIIYGIYLIKYSEYLRNKWNVELSCFFIAFIYDFVWYLMGRTSPSHFSSNKTNKSLLRFFFVSLNLIDSSNIFFSIFVSFFLLFICGRELFISWIVFRQDFWRVR